MGWSREKAGPKGSALEVWKSIDCRYSHRSSRIHKFVAFYLMAYGNGGGACLDPAEVDAALWMPMKQAIAETSLDSERTPSQC